MRTPPKSLAVVLIGASALLAAAAPARARTGFTGGPGSFVAAGSTVAIAWSLPEEAGESFREMELVLSLDGGRSFPFRVTGVLDPATDGLDWRVPGLPSRQARLALRVGNDEDPAEETLAFVSEEFTIEKPALSRAEPLIFLRGEWRVGDGIEDRDDSPDPAAALHRDTGPGPARVGEISRGGKRLPRLAAPERSAFRAPAFRFAADREHPAPPPLLPRLSANSPLRE